jgi:hypothetical protein
MNTLKENISNTTSSFYFKKEKNNLNTKGNFNISAIHNVTVPKK